jgi:uncharacterized protein (TIGR00255 family)
MAMSMTGYGRYETNVDGMKLTVEMRAVNHRFCEIQVRLPRQLAVFEERIKRLIREDIHRGRIEVYITFNAEALVSKKLLIDWELAQAYVSSLRDVQRRFNLSGDLSVQDLLSIEQIWQIDEDDAEHEGEFEIALMSAVKQSLEQLLRMRDQEGHALAQDLKLKINTIRELTEQIQRQAPHVREAYAQRLEKRIRDFLQQDHELDEGRMLMEVAIFADKSAIDEELTRLKSHCDQFGHILAHGGSIGRKLDFLVQEMNREANTIGSKANDITISQAVVELKSQLEMVKEQVQNLE